jgi:hypothetical protein
MQKQRSLVVVRLLVVAEGQGQRRRVKRAGRSGCAACGQQRESSLPLFSWKGTRPEPTFARRFKRGKRRAVAFTEASLTRGVRPGNGLTVKAGGKFSVARTHSLPVRCIEGGRGHGPGGLAGRLRPYDIFARRGFPHPSHSQSLYAIA